MKVAGISPFTILLYNRVLYYWCLHQSEARAASFSDQHEKHKLGRGRWDLASCQVSFNSIQRFQRRSRKCLSQSEAGVAIFVFRPARQNTNLVKHIEILLPVKVRRIPFSGFRDEVKLHSELLECLPTQSLTPIDNCHVCLLLNVS